MKKLLIAAVLCAVGPTASASTPTAAVSDTDGQTWNNCTFSATLTIPGSGFGPVPSVGGVPVTPLTVKGTCSASGVLTASLTDTSTVDQAGAKWVFKVCPNASVLPVTVTTTVIGSTPNLTPAFSQLAPPRFAAGDGAFGYSDIEVVNPLVGVSYFNTGALPGYRKYNLSGWAGGGGAGSIALTTIGTSGAATLLGGILNIPAYTGGGMTVPSTTAVLKGNGSGGVLAAAAGTDYAAASEPIGAAAQTTANTAVTNAAAAQATANAAATPASVATAVATGNSATATTAANLSGTPALPNGVTATTQTAGDNTTKLATDAFVLANRNAIANATLPIASGTVVAANICLAAAAVAMAGVVTTTAFTITPNADITAVVGWTPTASLYIVPWPVAGFLNYRICNGTAASITTGGTVTFNIGAK